MSLGRSPAQVAQMEKDMMLAHLLLVRQVSGLADCFRIILKDGLFECTPEAGEKLKGYTEYIKTELGDAEVIIQKICNMFGIDSQSAKVLGWERDLEKRKSYLERHPGNVWF